MCEGFDSNNSTEVSEHNFLSCAALKESPPRTISPPCLLQNLTALSELPDHIREAAVALSYTARHNHTSQDSLTTAHNGSRRPKSHRRCSRYANTTHIPLQQLITNDLPSLGLRPPHSTPTPHLRTPSTRQLPPHRRQRPPRSRRDHKTTR